MRRSIVLFPIAAGIAVAALAGCAPSPGPTPTVTTTVTATATVTATPAPASQAATDPMTPLAAWSICYGIAMSTGALPEKDYTPPTYQEKSVTATSTSGVYDVLLGFAPKDGGYGVGYSCTIGGTIGAPTVTDARGPYDFG